jgi:hypothetical protein
MPSGSERSASRPGDQRCGPFAFEDVDEALPVGEAVLDQGGAAVGQQTRSLDVGATYRPVMAWSAGSGLPGGDPVAVGGIVVAALESTIARRSRA